MILVHILIVLFLFGLTVFVHELGHFLLARKLGLVVDVFSIGFGPAIWKKTVGDVTYKIGWFPLGGYVALPQLDPSAHEEADERQLPAIVPWKRIIVSFAGAFFNILLAVVLAFVVYYGGRGLVYEEHDCTVGYVATNSLAYASGLRPGDIILEVNGRPISRWDQFVIEGTLATEVELKVESRDGAANLVVLPTGENESGGRLVDGIMKQMPCLIIGILPNSSAEAAGLQAGDIIRSFADEPIYSIPQLTELVNTRQDVSTPIRVSRGGTELSLMVTPRFDEEANRALIGIKHNPFDIYKTPGAQLLGWASPVFRLLKAFVTPGEARQAASSVGGPLAIFGMIWMAVRTSLLLAVWLTGLLNINLAILNLLPFPVLDGGHIVFALVEMVTRRRMPAKVVAVLANVFAALLITLFVVLTYSDFKRMILPLFQGRESDVEQVGEVPATGPGGEATSE